MHFGATLRLIRMNAGVPLRELARRIGVSGAYISRVEHGLDPIPSPDRLVSIARALGLPPATLIELTNRVSPLVGAYLEREPMAHSLFYEIARRQLSPAQLGAIHEFIEATFPLDEGQDPRDLRPRVGRYLDEDSIVLGIEAEELGDVFDIAATRIAPSLSGLNLCGPSPRELSELLREREEQAPTAIGGGYGIPHAIVSAPRSAIGLVSLAQPLPVAGVDGEPLDLLFIVAFGEEPVDRLLLLAELARLLRVSGEALREARSAGEARSIVDSFDRERRRFS